MYSRPSAPNSFEPLALLMKMGAPPTARNARTGELTPPGNSLSARSIRRAEVSSLMGRLYLSAAPGRSWLLPGLASHFQLARAPAGHQVKDRAWVAAISM